MIEDVGLEKPNTQNVWKQGRDGSVNKIKQTTSI